MNMHHNQSKKTAAPPVGQFWMQLNIQGVKIACTSDFVFKFGDFLCT
tara:strand:- start:18933 stop:19073 length:141 start_codon:yes stop_codon:yes gene_type:complete